MREADRSLGRCVNSRSAELLHYTTQFSRGQLFQPEHCLIVLFVAILAGAARPDRTVTLRLLINLLEPEHVPLAGYTMVTLARGTDWENQVLQLPALNLAAWLKCWMVPNPKTVCLKNSLAV